MITSRHFSLCSGYALWIVKRWQFYAASTMLFLAMVLESIWRVLQGSTYTIPTLTDHIEGLIYIPHFLSFRPPMRHRLCLRGSAVRHFMRSWWRRQQEQEQGRCWEDVSCSAVTPVATKRSCVTALSPRLLSPFTFTIVASSLGRSGWLQL